MQLDCHVQPVKPDGNLETPRLVVSHPDVRCALIVGGLADGLSIFPQRRKFLLHQQGGYGAGDMGPLQHTRGVIVSDHSKDLNGQSPLLALRQARVVCLHQWSGNVA